MGRRIANNFFELRHKIVFDQNIADILAHALRGEEAVIPHDLKVVGNVGYAHVEALCHIRNTGLFVLEHKAKNPDSGRVTGEFQEAGFLYQLLIKPKIFILHFLVHGDTITLT